KRFISEVKVTVRAYPSSMYALEYLGPVELIEHGRSATLHAELPAPIARELSGRDQCVIPTDLAFECGLLDRPKKIIADMFVQNIYANWGYSYLTDRPVDLDIVHSLNEGAAAESAFLEGLNHALPAVFRIPTASLVSLRKKEPEAFLVFRDRLRVLLDQCHGLSKPQVEREFSNTILPELNRLEKLVQIEAEAARIDLARDAVGLGVVSVALFSGLLPPQLASLVASVGGFGLGKCLLDDVKRLIVLPEVAKRSDFYFLWRALEDRSIQQKL
ncbi:MAG TPA: hypothetical protein VK745_11360, partial [Polyangiaceae bacterium]|nr:hypothetical protein [Polyangiaceae bacterium]